MGAVFGNLDLFWQGFGNTLLMLGGTLLFALPLGIVVAAMRISPFGSLRVAATVYTEWLRNTPLTLVFFFMVFVMPRLGVTIDFIPSAILALTLYTAPFFAEAIRSGINSVPVGQAEAARSIGLGFGQTVSLVILPQAIRSVIPPLINVTIALTKNTSVATGFFVFTLVSVLTRLIRNNPADLAMLFLGIAFCYLLITIPLGQLADRLEKRLVVTR
ncbi:amino acid ABC transporter permease [Herbiconiux sp. L3-i23]|uniref:amino acid ABC transporter permease n=1 Tax=Herbiconiux sp. L3-i23 TaxID=2905871 RepID=UPI002047D0F4|nr:amino acid ABC transporter permease [Herbiconiux sp. L3-i23]BDI22239.1 amino acid ABC transporter permease [Herbiconiux sp. L3-i23]